MSDLAIAQRLIEQTIERARQEARKSAIPVEVRVAWEKVRQHIIHNGGLDDARFELEDFFNGTTMLPVRASPKATSSRPMPIEVMAIPLFEGPYEGKIDIGSTVRLTWAHGPNLRGTLATVASFDNERGEWWITVRRSDDVSWRYPINKVEPFVETYHGYDVVWRYSRSVLHLYAYDDAGLSAFPYQQFHNLESLRAEIDKLVVALHA